MVPPLVSLATVYATDEDIAIRASSDFALLCPRDQKLAMGSDGAFSPAAPWSLSSSAVNFAAQGVAPGMIVQLLGPSTAFRPPGEAFVVDTISPGAATLRRKGQASGVGQPPSPASGLSAVEFLVATLNPQLENASYELNRRVGIDDLVVGRRSTDLYDPRELREATVLTVVYRQYLELSREIGGANDPLANKARALKEELDELLARLVIKWSINSAGGPAMLSEPARLGARLAR